MELWRNTFTNRSYCNLTFIGEDITWAGQKAYNKSSEVSRNAYENSIYYTLVAATAVQEKTGLAWNETKKYSNQASVETKKLYNAKVKPQYEKHAKPLVDKHVSPLVAKASKFVDEKVTPKVKQVEAKIQPKYDQLKVACKKYFNIAAEHYGVVCQKSYDFSKGVAKKHEIQMFEDKIAPHWEYSCQNPKDSLKAALIGILVIIMLPFVFSLLRLVLGVIYIVWRIFVAITPLRFFIGKSSTAKAPATGSRGEVRVKKKTRIAHSQ